MSRRFVIFYNMLILFLLYCVIALIFSLIYIALDIMEIGWIIDHYATNPHQQNPIDRLTRSLYFSCITLFAVGYGDITPFGLSKAVAVFQSLIGYILPYVLVINYLLFNPRVIKEIHKKL